MSKEIFLEVEHVKAHRTEKRKKEMTHFGKFVTDGNEKADELAKPGAMSNERFMAQTRAKRVQQEREEVYASLAVCSQLSLRGGGMEGTPVAGKRTIDFRGQEKKGNKASNGMVSCCQQVPMSEMWRRQQVHEDARKAYRAETCGNIFGKMEKATYGRTRYGKKNGQARRSFDLVHKNALPNMGPKLMNCCKPEQVGTKVYGNLKTNFDPRRWQDPCQGGKVLEV